MQTSLCIRRYFDCGVLTKPLLFMKITAILLLAACLQVSASGNSQKVTLSEKNAPMGKVFRSIKKQTGYAFFFDESWMRQAGSVTIEVKEEPLEKALDICFKNKPLTYSIVGNTIVIKLREQILQEKEPIFNTPVPIEIRGVITDENNKGLQGVSVTIKGSEIGTSTDANGNFTIQLPDNGGVLVISYVGYEVIETKVTKSGTLNFALKLKESQSEEVVVIGYGTQKKIDLTGSVSVVSAKDFDKSPVTGVVQALQGKVAGLQIVSASGQPGVGKSVLIRGIQSLNASTAPLYVLDGAIVGSVDEVNPDDIESISVLKDAASSAIYGSRAANGVIIITTKRGSKNRVPVITFHTYQGIQTESNLKLKLLNSTQWMELDKEAYVNAGIYNQSPYWDLVNNAPADLSYYNGVNTDWLKIIRQQGAMNFYNVSLSGGSDKSTFYTSVSYRKQKGMVIGTGDDNINFRFNSDHKINNFIEFGNSVVVSNSSSYGFPDITRVPGAATASGVPYDPYAGAIVQNPLTRPYESDGSYGYVRNQSIEGRGMPPQVIAHEYKNDNKNYGALGNLYLKIKIIDGLTFNPKVSIDYSSFTNSQFIPAIILQNVEGTALNSVVKYKASSLRWATNYALNYAKTFNKAHNLSALLLYSQEEQKYEDLYGLRYGTPNNTIQYLNAGQVLNQTSFGGYFDWSFVSYVGRLNYDYEQKYYVQATVRRDGSSRFLGKNRWGVFPSYSLGWRISKEKFFQGLTHVVNDLKLRTSIGTLGNSNVGNYPGYASLSLRNYDLNGTLSPTYTLSNAVNPDIRWETTKKDNFGLDAAFFNSTLTISADYFISHTTDLLNSKILPLSAGRTSNPIINSGEIENKGFEFVLGYRKTRGDFSFNVSTNFSLVRNTVLDLGGQILDITQGLIVGKPAYSFIGYKSLGIIKTQDILDKYPQKAGSGLGDLWIQDVDGYDANGKLTGKPDMKIDAADRTIIGKVFPDFTYGLVGSASYKGVSLQIAIMGVQGAVLNTTGPTMGYLQFPENSSTRILDRWEATKNPNGNLPKLTHNDVAKNITDMSSFWLSDASFLRINNLNLSYAIPEVICGKLKAKRLELYVSCQNLYTFTKFPGQEVDVNDQGQFRRPSSFIPQPRTLIGGIKASF